VLKLSTRRILRRAVRSPIQIEPVETRTMMSVSLDSAGFTKITPSADTRTVYVSASEGSDSNSGLSPSSPVKTLSKGASLLRSGSPDWMLLKKGDTWHEALPGWSKSGRSGQEPMVISSYGSGDRPDIKVANNKNAFDSSTPFHDVALIGLHLDASTRNPDSPDFTGGTGTAYGIRMVGQVKNFLVEDMQIDHFVYDVSLQGFSGYAQNITFRRNLITDAYDPGQKAQGLYASQIDGLTLDGNLFDHNGWNEEVAGAGPILLGHNIYLYNSTKNVVVKNNIIANASSHGIQARGGGIIENNLFLNNPISLLFGTGGPVLEGGVSGDVKNNVFIGSRGIGSSLRGWAIEVSNTKPGANVDVSGNLIADDTQNANPAIKLEVSSEGVGINDVTIEDNIVYKWYQGLGISSSLVTGGSGASALNDLVVRNNDFQDTSSQKIISHGAAYKDAEEDWGGNRYFDSKASSEWFSLSGATTSLDAWKAKVESSAISLDASYPDPTRTAGSYNATLGGSNSTSAFLAEVRKQSADTWRAKYTATAANEYIEGGFTGVVKDGGSTNVTPTPTPAPTPTPPNTVNSAPTAALIASDLAANGQSVYQFKVRYTDDTAVQVNSFGNLDIKVIGPNSFTQAATFVSADNTTNGAVRTATYQITAPGGTWNSGSDAGTYTISLNANGVKDTSGLYAAAQTLGTFRLQ
jgi:hypothetical protein